MPEPESAALSRLIGDLRRRRVFRTAAAYVVAAWVVIQVVDTVGPDLGFPAGATRFVVYAALLAFPLVLALAWMFDVGSDEKVGWSGRRTGVVFVASLPLLVGLVWAVAGPGPDELDEQGARSLASEAAALAGEGRLAEAYERAERALAVLPEDSALAALRDSVSTPVTIRTEPPTAAVRAQPIHAMRAAAPQAAWQDWGTTPVETRRIPRVDHRVVVTRDGYRPVERLVAPSFAQVERPGVDYDAPLELRIALEPDDSPAPADMVPVPGGEYELASPDMPVGFTATLDDFYIDRFEVTNHRFAEFVDAGGYANSAHWAALPDSLGDPAARFTDATGRPGPRRWRDGTYPAGEADLPATGVTWYEAAAYAAFRGRALPTLHQWEKAARDGGTTGHDGYVLPWGIVRGEQLTGSRSRSQAAAPGPVDEHPFGMSPYGVYAMAGNAKEWLANPYGDGRAATGGSWQDPLYLFSEVGGYDPTFASPAIGFRTVWLDPDRRRLSRDQGLMSLTPPETPEWQPVDSVTYAGLLTHFRYDRRSARAEIVATVEAADWDRQQIEFDGPEGERVTAYLWLPHRAIPPYQPILYVPSSDAFFNRVSDEVENVVGPLVRNGRAVFAVVMKGMTGRPNQRGHEVPSLSSVAFRDRMVLHATEMRLGLDYLETRDDLDVGRLSYVGLSWGAGSRLALAAVDPRVRAVVLIGGGIDERLKPVLPEVDNVNHAPRIDAPTLMVNGRQDEEHAWLTRGRALWNLLGEPKRLVLLDGEGHLPGSEALIPAIETFLDETLGPPDVAGSP